MRTQQANLGLESHRRSTGISLINDTFTPTADEVLDGVDLSDRHVIVTGATGGLGLAASEAFARAGAELVLVGRDPAKLDAARIAVSNSGSGSVGVHGADLSDLDSVAALVTELRASLDRIDVLVLNAGVMASPLERSLQGHEMQLAASYLGHAALTIGLIDLLVESEVRVVTLSSSGHRLAGYDFDDPDFQTRGYDKWAAYGQAKTATALMAIALAERYGADGITAAAVHPGVIVTDLQRHLASEEAEKVLAMSGTHGELRTVEAGAASICWAATTPEIADNNGSYVANCSLQPGLRAPHASSVDDAVRLWDETLELISRTG